MYEGSDTGEHARTVTIPKGQQKAPAPSRAPTETTEAGKAVSLESGRSGEPAVPATPPPAIQPVLITRNGTVTERHDSGDSGVLAALLENREPTAEERGDILGQAEHTWTVRYPGDTSENARGKLSIKIWDPTAKHFPGWNAPVAEIREGNNRLACQRLKEVGWAEDVWAESHEGRNYLYVQSKHRFRRAPGIYVYELMPEDFTLRFGGTVFFKDDLGKER